MYWHKARIRTQYIVEMEVYEIEKSRSYPSGFKYGLVLVDLETGRRVLMDNHHPKGHHIHIDDTEYAYAYAYRDREKLMQDFRDLAFKHLGVKL